ncbi:hypothetical protein BsWGS_04173 [Bradybaena similaris]
MIRLRSLTPLLLAVLCCLACVIVLRDRTARFVITIHSHPLDDEMQWIIRHQRQTIRELSAHPRVIFRCPEDGPVIEYPSHASDDLTEMTMTTNDECENASQMDAIIMVHTAANHFKRRQQFRNIYSNYSNTKPYRLQVVFLIGSALNASLQLKLERENRDSGDTVVGAFLDTYHNLTLKAVMGFRWLTSACPDVKLLIKMDDDVIFDARKFFTSYWTRMGNDRKKKALHCFVWNKAQVGRTGKWKVETDLFRESNYPFPYCAGFFVVVSPDLIKPLYVHGKNMRFFWIDDVFLYGMVPASIGGVHFIQLQRRKDTIVDNYSDLESCRERNGPGKCSVWAALASKDEDFDLEYSAMLSPGMMFTKKKENVNATFKVNVTIKEI